MKGQKNLVRVLVSFLKYLVQQDFMLLVKEGDAYGKIDLNERISINF